MRNGVVLFSEPFFQPNQNGHYIPSLIGEPLVPLDVKYNNVSYLKMNKDIINQVNEEKMNEVNTNDLLEKSNNLYKFWKNKCNLHQKKLSIKCRRCKEIMELIKIHLEEKEEISKNNSSLNILKLTKNDNSQESKKQEFHIQENNLSGNLNSLLLNNILSCQYFKEVILSKSLQDLIEEIKVNVNNIEAWATGINGVPSTFYCCLYGIMLLNPGTEDIIQLLNHSNVYVKITGIIYLRYMAEPKYLWEYLLPFLNDKTEFYPQVNHKKIITVENYVISLFKNDNHYGTRLPRIPVNIEREIQLKLIYHSNKKERELTNMKLKNDIKIGSKVIYFTESKNDYETGIITEIINPVFDKETSNSKFTIKLDTGAIANDCDLGDFELVEKKFDRDNSNKEKSDKKEIKEKLIKEDKNFSSYNKKHYHNNQGHYPHYNRTKKDYRRSRSRSNENKKEKVEKNDLMIKVIENEKKTVIAKGKNYAVKPNGFKTCITIKDGTRLRENL